MRHDWNEKIIGFLIRNDTTMIALVILMAFICLGINWDVIRRAFL